VFAHTRGEEALSRFIEANSGALFDQHANLAQLVLAQPLPMSLAFAHQSPVFWAALSASPICEEELHFLTESACRTGRSEFSFAADAALDDARIAPVLRSIDQTI